MAGEKHSTLYPLEILSLLEISPLTTLQIGTKLHEYDYSERHINRIIKDMKDSGFPVITKNREHHLQDNELEYRKHLLRSLSRLAMESALLRSVIHGTIVPEEASQMLSHIRQPAGLLLKIIRAMENGKVCTFHYTPQNERTLGAVRFVRKHFSITVPRDKIPVLLIASHIVFSGENILLLGKALHGSAYGKTRQYLLRGLDSIEISPPPDGLPPEFREKPNPAELYKTSLKSWIGGREYDLELEEIHLDGRREKTRKRVNGEEEIIAHLASSLGRRKLINPPEQIVHRADEIGYSRDLLFRFEPEEEDRNPPG